MKHKLSIFVILIFILTSSFSVGYNWAQAWVDDATITKSNLSKPILSQVTEKHLTLIVLTKKYLIKTASNGNTYLHCYLVNGTDTTTSIGRADATITGFSTEILKDSIWQQFQLPINSDCGNSYWTQKLKIKTALSIRLDHNEIGPIRVPFRIRFDHNNNVIYSNIITVDIDQKNYDRVGNSKK
ncbi:MAG: hypothetical protein V5804_13535 [Mucilaginibacter sp.]|uniref:hypothetical protein n=1 Tax=Mucilaginibacter sp. TaxID=1882438 RepID=UPI0034E47746